MIDIRIVKMSIKRRNIFIRLWWKISNKFIRRKNTIIDKKTKELWEDYEERRKF